MRFLPNIITVLRTLLIPVLAYMLFERRYGVAFVVFVAAAASDVADGFIARRFNAVSEFGALLDPIADKLTMIVAAVMLAWQALLPVWLAAAIVVRDLVIVGGAIAYRRVVGHIEMQPTVLSKLNTGLEFALLACVLAQAARVLDASAWLPSAFAVLFATIVVSGVQYVWVWGRKAAKRAP